VVTKGGFKRGRGKRGWGVAASSSVHLFPSAASGGGRRREGGGGKKEGAVPSFPSGCRAEETRKKKGKEGALVPSVSFCGRSRKERNSGEKKKKGWGVEGEGPAAPAAPNLGPVSKVGEKRKGPVLSGTGREKKEGEEEKKKGVGGAGLTGDSSGSRCRQEKEGKKENPTATQLR